MTTRPANDIGSLERKYRGLAIEDGLRDAAEALAREVGAPERPERRRRDAGQFPFATALAQHARLMDARYGGLLEAAPDAMIVANGDGEIVLINAQAEARLGYERRELLGRKLTAVLDGPLAEALATGTARPEGELKSADGVEMTGIRKDGIHFTVEVTTSVLEGDEGTLVTLALRDISVRKAAERRLMRLEARARTLLEQAPDAIVVLSKRGGVLLFNARAQALFGYNDEEVLGRPASLLVPVGLLERLVGEDGGPAYRTVAETAGTPVVAEAVRKDGSATTVEMTLGALKGNEGVLFTAIFRDIGVRAGEPARAEARPLLALLEDAPDAMIAIDARGDIVLYNERATRCLGYAADEVLGMPVTRVFPDGLADHLAVDPSGATEASLALEIGARIELPALCKDGAVLTAEVALSRIELPDGPRLLVSIRESRPKRGENWPLADDAGRRRLEVLERRVRELSRVGEDLAQFAEVSANTLREPLRRLVETGERLAAALAESTDGGAAKQARARDMIDQAAHMQALVTDLLAYARLGREPFAPVRIAAQSLLEGAVAGLAREIVESGAIVANDVLPEIECVPEEIVLLLRNVLANAIAYRASEPPRVRVSAAPNSAGDWVFAIADNGIGIERQYFERIFMLFQRLHRHHAIPGTGIGLAICRRIAERHGGRMWVDSRPGLGTTFYLALPSRRPE